MAGPRFSIYMTAHAVREFGKNEELFRRFLDVAKSLGVERVYVENYRDGLLLPDEEVDAMAKRLSRDFEVAGGSCIGTWGQGWFDYEGYGFRVICISDERNWPLLANAMSRLARHFDEILIDDFWAQWCHSERDVARFNEMFGMNLTRDALFKAMRRGDRRIMELWSIYSTRMLSDVSRNYVVAPAKDANSRVRVNLKVAEWREDFAHRGLKLGEMAKVFDGIYVGTESREGTEQYGSFYITEFARAIVGDKLGGVWFDTFNGIFHGDRLIDPEIYVRQLWFSSLTTIGEIVLFDAMSLVRENRAPHIASLKAELPVLRQVYGKQSLDKLGLLIPAIQASITAADRYLHDYLGMVGIPLRPVPPSKVGRGDYVLVTEHVADYVDLIKLANDGVNMVLTSGAVESILSGSQGREGLRLLGVVEDAPLIADTMDALYFVYGGSAYAYTHRRPGVFPVGPILNVSSGARPIVYAGDGVSEYPVIYMNEYGNSKIYVAAVTKYPPYLKEYYPEVVRSVLRDIAMEYVGLKVEANAAIMKDISLIPYANGRVVIYNMNNSPVDTTLYVDLRRLGEVKSASVAGGRGVVREVSAKENLLLVHLTIENNSPLMVELAR